MVICPIKWWSQEGAQVTASQVLLQSLRIKWFLLSVWSHLIVFYRCSVEVVVRSGRGKRGGKYGTLSSLHARQIMYSIHCYFKSPQEDVTELWCTKICAISTLAALIWNVIKWDVHTWCRSKLCSLKEVCVGSILQLFLCGVHLLWPNWRLNPVL